MQVTTLLALELVFLLCFAGVFWVGYQIGKRSKPKPIELDERERQRAKQFNEDFAAIMAYDLTTAMKGKKVT